MKRKRKNLKLNRETLGLLGVPALQAAEGMGPLAAEDCPDKPIRLSIDLCSVALDGCA